MSSTANHRALIASVPSKITRFFASSSLTHDTPSILLVLNERNYSLWNNLKYDFSELIVIRPLRYLAPYAYIDSKWVQFPERISDSKLVLMSIEEYQRAFVPQSLAGRG